MIPQEREDPLRGFGQYFITLSKKQGIRVNTKSILPLSIIEIISSRCEMIPKTSSYWVGRCLLAPLSYPMRGRHSFLHDTMTQTSQEHKRAVLPPQTGSLAYKQRSRFPPPGIQTPGSKLNWGW